MSDQALRALERGAVGQPGCARLLVAIGRANAAREWVVSLSNGWHLPIRVIYPLFDGSGWAVLTVMGAGFRVDNPNIASVYRRSE